MTYTCINCNYETNDPANFSRHKKTKKHLTNLDINKSNCRIQLANVAQNVAFVAENVALDANTKTTVKNEKKLNYVCKECNLDFKHHSSYYRHKKICKNNGFINIKNRDILEQELKLKLEFAEKEKEIFKKLEQEKSDLLNNFMANANVLLNKATDNTKITAQAMQSVSVSALKYANEKFKDTPALLPINNFNINNLSFEDENDKKQLIEILLYNAKQKSLDKLLGDHIVKYYKKDNPEELSFHTTDSSRLNYIVRELIENALIWSVDKSGIKICSSIVKPLIEKCINLLLDYQKELIDLMSSGDFTNKDSITTIISVLMSIDKGSLESDVNKYIAPYFNLDKI